MNAMRLFRGQHDPNETEREWIERRERAVARAARHAAPLPQAPDIDDTARVTVSRWNHETAADYVHMQALIERAERSDALWRDVKARSAEAVRLACRIEAAAGRHPGYHDLASQRATIKKATAEIAKQEARISAAQKLLSAAHEALRNAQGLNIPDTDDNREHAARKARAIATHLQDETAQARANARAVAVPQSLYRRRQECLDLLSKRAADPQYARLVPMTVTPQQITIAMDKNGAPNPTTYTVAAITKP